MKKPLFFVFFIATTLTLAAQKGTNYIQLAGEFGIPTGDFSEVVGVGPGISAKALFGVSDAGQVTVGTGYTRFGIKDLPDGVKAHYSVVPLLAGYRHNFSGLYIEPQLGLGIYGLRAKGFGESDSDSENAFTWAAGFGYAKNGLDIGVRYQSGKIPDADSPISAVGIHIGYNFSLGAR